ncbi:hypothetical protein [Psychromonas sp. MME2]|uniref:hypothetical protein n=1 Tax=unclassified Psychromonas TaxID=2614957 RepID=UPI00339BF6CF
MMEIKLEDISRNDIGSTIYDLAIFSIGYELRCTHLPSILNKANINTSIILSYQENQGCKNRAISSKFYNSEWPNAAYIEQEHSETEKLYKYLVDFTKKCVHIGVKPKILIDYTSMSRNWYSAILNYFLRFSEIESELYLSYSSAIYPEDHEYLDFELGELRVIPGCEGTSITKKKKAAIFMLGFDRVGPQSFYNLLEPDISYGVIASPGAKPNYDEIALSINKQFIEHQIKDDNRLIKLPISSVSFTFENLCQIVSPLRDEYNISIIPFGPKPHILASIIVGLYYKNVSCIYSEYKRSKIFSIVASGEVVSTKVTTLKIPPM